MQPIRMKSVRVLLLFLFFPSVFYAQKTLTGLWIGSLTQDSLTIRKDQAFEMALTQYKEKVYGYSRSSFIVNDTLYYVLKRVKGTIDGDLCEIKDDEVVSYNFPGKLDKGVHVTIQFRRNLVDSAWYLSGEWKTNSTKRYRFYSITGKVDLKEEADFEKSKIFPHLEELKMDKDVAFYASARNNQNTAPVQNKEGDISKSEPDIARHSTKESGSPQNKPAEKPAETAKHTLPANASGTSPSSPLKKTENETAIIAKAEPGKVTQGTSATQSAETIATYASLKKSEIPAATISREANKDMDAGAGRPSVKKQESRIIKSEPAAPITSAPDSKENKKPDLVNVVKPEEEKKISNTTVTLTVPKAPAAAAFVGQRKTVAPQVVYFQSDSLELALYDNGEIDGDTVSVLLNGEIVIARQGLKASAVKKTIYVTPGMEEMELVLYAENLGKYPPNTGLLVVHDGESLYQLRFSADLHQNAAVIFRRKK